MSRNPINRKSFIALAASFVAGLPFASSIKARMLSPTRPMPAKGDFPTTVISSGNGLEAVKKAYRMIKRGEDCLDAVIAGVNIVENDPNDMSVGYGGLPNEDGVVELDSAVMHGPTHRAGSVAALQNIKNPSKVAKLVMEYTDHVLLVGEGALKFARAHGVPETNLLTDQTRQVWLRWKTSHSDRDDWLMPLKDYIEKTEGERPTGTIHCSGMNSDGDISCTTTTSGLAYKIPGRVGDSPIIGAGLYVDNEVGSCGSTGRGETNLQDLCSFAVVEFMRQGMSPEEAGMEILRRVEQHNHDPRLKDKDGHPNFGLKFYILAKDGRYAGVGMRGPGKFAIADKKGARLEEIKFLYKRR